MTVSPSLIEVRNNNLPAYAVFAAMLSAAGLPIYIHAPKYFVDEYGVSLVALGSVLFILRLLDVVQDPFFGRLSARLGRRRGVAISVACVVMALGMLGLFLNIERLSAREIEVLREEYKAQRDAAGKLKRLV